ncbi:DUF2252 domain-containing protein [Variovorax sp. YR216]|uniref:DUF2252 domain-containing protein n=1 Tax=Variovorax sp. YR216 TaxID=1882828 RepID=UPI000896990F|nr:DUF2252 family protein [Variovorax sp. YR216]SEA41762.1 Uncharacterized conserved protein, DUF2252 family [Variovorax sp. YR216]
MDVVREIRSFNQGRDPDRLALKYRSMRTSPFVFLRGTCHLFYDRLARIGAPRSAPLTWVCGDLHLENFGSYKGDNRLVYFDINDFDEAALAPASWDLIRFLTSLWVGAESISVGTREVRRLCEIFIDSYASALCNGKAYWVERDTAQGLVRVLLDGLRERQRSQFLASRTDMKGRRRVLRADGKKALAASDQQRAMAVKVIHEFAAAQPNPKFYEVLDVARRIAGTGSLGVDRYAILVEGKGSPDGNYVLDLKQAMPSSLVPHLKKVEQPKWKSEAHRVVTLQRRVQAVSMAFLQPVVVGQSPYVLRALQPAEDRVALGGKSAQSASDLEGVITVMAKLVAWAQLRSGGREGSDIADELIDFGQRSKWKTRVLDASIEAAKQVQQDWSTYAAAYDAGAYSSSDRPSGA